MSEAPRIVPMKKRPEYLRVAAARTRFAAPGLVVQMAKEKPGGGNVIRAGLTVSARAGSAVERNRIKRRLRQVMREVLPAHGRAGRAYVVIGRRAALKRPYALLQKDLQSALDALHKQKP